MSLVYIFAASPAEAEPVRKIAASGSSSAARCGANDVVLIVGGMGPLNAKRKAEAILVATADAPPTHKPDAVLVIGLCGGLTDKLQERRIVAYTGCGSTEPATPILPCSESILNATISVLSSSGIQCDRAVGITSPRIATTPDERLALAKWGATVVDMESYSILSAVSAAGVPAAVLRVVADSPDRVLPDLNSALDASGGLDGRKALKVALRSPVRTARLIAANRRAMRSLSKALEIVVKAPCFA
jgi:nucleoside phosphorylase